MGLSQSDKIFGALLIAFIIYITVRGQLSGPNGYLGIFQHAASSSTSSNPISGLINSAGGFAQGVQSLIDNASKSFGDIGEGATAAGEVGGLAG